MKKKGIIVGKFNKHAKGFGFVKTDIDDIPEIFISKHSTKGAMDQDMVAVDLIPGYLWEERPEGIITKIINRAQVQVVGTLEAHKGFGFVVAEDKGIKDDIFIKKENFNGAGNGDKVVALITLYPTGKHKAEGKIIEIIARANDCDGEMKALIRAKGLTEEFPLEALAQTKMLAKTILQGNRIRISQDEIKGRVDLRDKQIITIDGASSKDLDDGVSVELTKNGNYLLGVHIADVSHYVTENSPLDQEALKRGNSVYLLNTVVPMLPKELSNGICSLNEGVDRLTLTCQMEIDKSGDVVNHQIFPSIINSKARLIYDDVSDIIENGDLAQKERYSHLLNQLELMNRLAQLLRTRRKESGSLDFDLPEANIILDEDSRPIKVEVQPRRTANIIIEEFMLAANRTVAEHFYWLSLPFVYRVHENPDPDKMVQLKSFLGMLGIPLKGKTEAIHPNTLREIMARVEGQPCETIINTVILRSMKKAFYSTQCLGHFGLAYNYYCHFTSPIRRYPDLIIHRIIKKALEGQISEDEITKLENATENAAKLSSDSEKKAQELERDVEKFKKAQYMENYIGRKFQGVISGVTEFGIYVQLENTIEGMARLDSFRDDIYIFDPKRYRVIGERTNNVYALGQRVLIRVKGTYPKARQIDFDILRKI